MKKVVSFSVWGSNEMYLTGIQKNFDLIKKYYPDWQMVVYYDESVPQNRLNNSDITYIKFDQNYNGLCSRFLAFFDADVCLSRDLDSRITEREVHCVNRWLDTNKKILSLKDHPRHINGDFRPILGGMVGVRNKFDNEDKQILESYLKDKQWDGDSFYLRDHINKKYKNEILELSFINDEYLKTTRNENFIGQGYHEDNRPRYHWQTGEILL